MSEDNARAAGRIRPSAMIVIINGSFGVGKTTVARLVRAALPGSVIYDPEWAGLALLRLPRWSGLQGSGTDDFQDMPLWRRSAIVGPRLCRAFTSGAVIVPMTFSRCDYFAEVVAGISQLSPEVRVFCLQASLATVKQRLSARGEQTAGPKADWIRRRIIECAVAHRDPHFGEPVGTEDRSAREVAEEIVKRLRPAR